MVSFRARETERRCFISVKKDELAVICSRVEPERLEACGQGGDRACEGEGQRRVIVRDIPPLPTSGECAGFSAWSLDPWGINE